MPDRGRVLVVDDDAITREMLRLVLEDGGFEPILAADDRAAVAVLEADDGRGLVGLITDINLGGGRSGWFVAQRARAVRPDLPVIYVTGASGHEWRTMGAPGSLLMLKPFTPAHVLDGLDLLIGQARRRD